MRYPRDLRGYAGRPPFADWPGGANVAVQIVLNVEEGGENCLLHGDGASEAFLSEIVGAEPWPGQRHWNMESLYEYGARAGFWRLHDLFVRANVPVTAFAVTTALERAPDQLAAMQEAGFEIACHGLKWIEHKDLAPKEERALIEDAVRRHEICVGERPKGFYTGRCSVHTLDLLTEVGGFSYLSDSYADDLPYWRDHRGREQLIVPYTLDANDMRFATAQGFNSGAQFHDYLLDGFETLWEEGERGAPKMLSIGLHARIAGRPGRIRALERFLDHARAKGKVWFATRLEIAEHWKALHPPPDRTNLPSRMDARRFVEAFGGIYEGSPWIAERAFASELGPAADGPVGLAAALRAVFRGASREERRAVLLAHPDLAGKLAAAERLTAESAREQSSAGLGALTDEERAAFERLNAAYREKFGFPFVMAVKGRGKREILAAFAERIERDQEREFAEASRQVEKIAEMRVRAWFEEREKGR